LSNARARRDATHVHVGLHIKQAREAAGTGIRDFVTRLGATATRVAGIEAGNERLAARQIFTIATILNRSVAYTPRRDSSADRSVLPNTGFRYGGATSSGCCAGSLKSTLAFAPYERAHRRAVHWQHANETKSHKR